MRKKYIDFLRLAALFYMFFHHAVISLLKPVDNNGIIYFLYKIVPLDPALFLFIAGFSITLSFDKIVSNDKNYFIHLLKRGIILITAASILFFIQFGIQLPDILISSGILNSIGWMLIISGIFLKIKYKEILVALFILMLILFNLFFELKNILIVPFNSGYEPVSPTIIFGFIGFFIGLILLKLKNNNIKNIFIFLIFISGTITFAFSSINYGFFNILKVDEGTYLIQRTFNEAYLPLNLFKFNKSLTASFFSEQIWNYKMICFLTSLGIVFIFFSVFFCLDKYFLKYMPENIFLPGRFAFFNYFYHLGILALFVILFGYNNFSILIFIIFLIILYISSYLITFLIYKYKIIKNGH